MCRLLIQMVTALTITTIANAQIDWRFGFEDTWSHLSVWLKGAQRDALLTKLEYIVEAQQVGGDINFPALNSGWNGKQSHAGAPIKFDTSDQMVQLLQNHGFSMLWNLRINAKWASAGNPDCYGLGDCAPDSAHEQDLYDYIYAVVERYDGDGYWDMGYETPDDPSDDLRIPIQFYLMTGEIEFAGAYPPSEPGYGDEARNHFWTDSIENLLRTHRIIYQAMHDANPSDNTKLVSSGGVFFDLYSDFPDWPEIEGATVQARLNGNNNHNAIYVESFNRLKQMLTSFGDDSDGIECDYIGWHPHMPWREIDQAFSFIKTYAGNKPIYVDDMWCNIFLADRADSPGATLFTGGGQTIEGDFPNSLVPSYTALRNGVIFNNHQIVNWYYAKHARKIVKAFASVFGEGAERASISGICDIGGILRLNPGGYIDIMGTPAENFFEKPGYYTYKLLVDKLHDFVKVRELVVSNDPRTRVYEFERLERGPVYILWSETGEAPPDLDYHIPTGETVTLKVANNVDSLKLTHIITDTLNINPEEEIIATQDGQLTIQLGYEPVFLEGDLLTDVQSYPQSSLPSSFDLKQNYPNPFSAKGGSASGGNPQTTIRYNLPNECHITMEIFNVVGQRVRLLSSRVQGPGHAQVVWDGRDELEKPMCSGVYLYRVTATAVLTEGSNAEILFQQTKKMLLVK